MEYIFIPILLVLFWTHLPKKRNTLFPYLFLDSPIITPLLFKQHGLLHSRKAQVSSQLQFQERQAEKFQGQDEIPLSFLSSVCQGCCSQPALSDYSEPRVPSTFIHCLVVQHLSVNYSLTGLERKSCSCPIGKLDKKHSSKNMNKEEVRVNTL